MKKTKGKPHLYFMLFILIFALSACTSSPDFDVYKGKSLRIAVIGERPEVQEEQVRFKEISFDELISEELEYYDAVFITKENLSAAAESQYADIYLQSTIPFFFIQTTKGYLPFIDKEIEYDEAIDLSDNHSYATGFFASVKDGNHRYLRYGLYNDKLNDENIKGMYSEIFTTIEQQ